MQDKQQEHYIWTFALIFGLHVLTFLSIATIVAAMTLLSQKSPVFVLLLASSLAGASAGATIWVLWQSNPWAISPPRHLRRLFIRQPASTRTGAGSQRGKWVLGIMFFGLIIVGLGIIFSTAREPEPFQKPTQDLLVAVGVLLIGTPFAIIMRKAPTAISLGLVLFALIVFVFPVLSDVVICGVIKHDLRWFCATFDDFQKFRSGYTGIGFMFLGIALPQLVGVALERRPETPDWEE